MKKKALVALVLAVIAAAILVPTVVLAAPSSQGAPPATADQTARAKPWVGVAVVPLNDRLAERLGLVGKTGLVVLHVAPEGPAAKAGLKPRDLITTVNGQPVGTVQSLQEAIKTAGLGGSITLGVFRDGVDLAPMTVALAERPGRPKPEAHALPGIKPHGKLHQGSATFEDRDGKSSPSASLPAPSAPRATAA